MTLKIKKWQEDGSSQPAQRSQGIQRLSMTVSDDAVCIIAGLMPNGILAVERKQLYELRSSILGEQEALKKFMRHDSLQRWQEKWDASEKGRWIHRLISQVDNLVNRKHGVNYYLTQMPCNHKYFPAYLYRFKYDESRPA